MEAKTPTIWTKVDFELADVGDSDRRPAGDPIPRRGLLNPNIRRVLDVLAGVFWAYALLKVFVFDIDSQLLGSLADYRFFFFVGTAAFIVLAFRRPVWILGAVLYCALFPLIVLCWKLPRAIHRTRSWIAAFAVMHVIVAIVADLKYSVLATAAALFAGLAILVEGPRWLTAAAAVAILALLVLALARNIRNAVTPSRFLELQQRGISRAVDSGLMRELTGANEEWRTSAIEKFRPDQQQQFVQKLSLGVTHTALLFWAHQLDEYRQSPASVFLSALSIIGLLIQAILGFALINMALYHIDSNAFSHATEPSFIVFVRYSLVSLYGGEIDAIRAQSDLANAISIASTLVGGVLILTLIVSVLLSFRQQRNDQQIRATIAQIGTRAPRWIAVLRRITRSRRRKRWHGSSSSALRCS